MAAAAPTHDEVLNILATSSADPTTVTQLESYVRAQVDSLYGPSASVGVGAKAAPQSPYSFEANRALAKLYQFFPHLADESCTALILLLSLLEYPSTDFTALTCLVPERVQEREPCATLSRCSDLLEQSQFGTFWVTFRELIINESENASEELKMAAASPAAVSKVRGNILTLLSLTYKVAPVDTVLSALDCKDGAALREYVNGDETAKRLVENVDGDKVIFASSEANTKASRVFKEAVGLDAIIANLHAQ